MVLGPEQKSGLFHFARDGDLADVETRDGYEKSLIQLEIAYRVSRGAATVAVDRGTLVTSPTRGEGDEEG